MWGNKRKQQIREDALGAVLDNFFTYDEDHDVYVARSERVGGTYMEELLDFIVEKGCSPSLTDLSNAKK